jgi:hypothetical protein
VSADQGAAPARCWMAPERVVITLANTGFVDVDHPKPIGCDEMPANAQRGALAAAELVVHPEGPEGSGRYWTVTIGLAPTRGGVPTRGVCLATSTAGFRSLRTFGNRALSWLVDRDGDARSRRR